MDHFLVKIEKDCSGDMLTIKKVTEEQLKLPKYEIFRQGVISGTKRFLVVSADIDPKLLFVLANLNS